MLINYLGFLLAAWSVIGNDLIQTLDTFLQSNKKQDWKTIFLYLGGILTIVLFAGWYLNSRNVTYGRLESTTWAFIGILAGCEIAIRHRRKEGEMKAGVQLVLVDFGKVLVGIIVNICSIMLLSEFPNLS
jgi:flagellar biogenesis protein FliO